jgi:hypothetical protein
MSRTKTEIYSGVIMMAYLNKDGIRKITIADRVRVRPSVRCILGKKKEMAWSEFS